MKKIDTRGLSCPEPVLRAREELKKLGGDEPLDVLVDTVTARENVCRTAKSMGYCAKVTEADADYVVHISKKGN